MLCLQMFFNRIRVDRDYLKLSLELALGDYDWLSWVLSINCILEYNLSVKNLAIKRRNHKDKKDTERLQNRFVKLITP
jgi:hypothetical protein